MAVPDSAHRGARWALTYLLILAFGAAVVALVLPIGRGITPAPQAARFGMVSGAGAACLGDRLATVQSGVFVDLYVPGRAGADAGDELGANVATGRIDRTTGRGTLRGTCAPGGALDGQRFDLEATFVRDPEDGPATVVGDVTVAGDTLAVAVSPDLTGPERQTDADPPLEGSELVGRIFLAVAVVIVASRALGYVFNRIRQPRVMGEIVAGILLGPSLVGLYAPEVTTYLFPPEVTSVLKVLAQFGLIFFMFLIGLELDHKLIRGSGHAAVLISHVSIVLPFALGMLASLVLYPLLGSGSFTGFSLFMGASMAITAFPVLARILTDTGLHRTRLGALSITCAAVDDVTAWCILAVVVAVVKSAGPADAVQTAALSLVFVLGMLFVVRPLAGRLVAVHEARGKLNPPIMAGLIVGLFLAAWATEEIGIHAIFGAFMLGAVMPRSRTLVAGITERIEDVTVLFLLPIFFAVVGLSTRFGLLDKAELWVIAALVIGLAIVGKWGGSMIAARAAGQTWRYSTGLGILMNTRGLTEVVILSIGRSLGVISPALFTIMVLMALVTTFMATPLLAYVYPRRLIDRETARAAVIERVGHGIGAERRVLVGVGNPRHAGPLIQLVADIRSSDRGVPAVLLAHVIPPPGREEVRANLSAFDVEARAAAEALEPLAAGLRASGHQVDVVSTVSDDTGTELARLAEQHHADLVVTGGHQAFAGSHPLGGAVGELLDAARCDVAVLVDRASTGAGTGASGSSGPAPGPVAVWFKGILRDQAALDLAASIARGRETSLLVVQPVPVGIGIPDLGVPVERVVLDAPELPLALRALGGASMVVVGRADEADGALPRLRAGVIADAPIPVLVVQGEREGIVPSPASDEVDRMSAPPYPNWQRTGP